MTKRSPKGQRQSNVGEHNLVAIFGIIAVLMGAVYFVEVNRSTTKSFAVHALVQQQSQLLEQKRDLELQQAQMTALSTLQNSSVVAELVATTHTEYLSTSLSDVARR